MPGGDDQVLVVNWPYSNNGPKECPCISSGQFLPFLYIISGWGNKDPMSEATASRQYLGTLASAPNDMSNVGTYLLMFRVCHTTRTHLVFSS